MYSCTNIGMYIDGLVHVSNNHSWSTRNKSALNLKWWPTSFFSNVLKFWNCIWKHFWSVTVIFFFKKNLASRHNINFKILLIYHELSPCRHTLYSIPSVRFRYRRPTFIGVWYGGEVNSVTLMKPLLHVHVNTGSGSARTRSSVSLDPLICFPERAAFSTTASMVNQILGSRLRPTPFLRSLWCQNMTHGFI